jgi:hypothetical protein
MVLNTKEISARIKFSIMLSSLVYAGLLVASLVLAWSKTHIFEIGLTVVFVSWISFVFLKNFFYIFYNSDGPKIIIRYTSLQPLTAGNFSIEVPKKDFVKAEIVKSHLGFRKSLLIYVRTAQGVAKFNPVSLSILSKSEIEAIKTDLNIN